jgi:hypothetical protein
MAMRTRYAMGATPTRRCTCRFGAAGRPEKNVS